MFGVDFVMHVYSSLGVFFLVMEREGADGCFVWFVLLLLLCMRLCWSVSKCLILLL